MRTFCAICLALFTSMVTDAQVAAKPKTATKKAAAKKAAARKPVKKIVIINLRGSADIARLQNKWADDADLTRLEDDRQLQRFIKAGLLVPLPDNALVQVDSRINPRYRYCRPWTRDFLNDLGRAHVLQFRHPIRITSAVRTTLSQKKLRTRNGNAAPTDGPFRSSHLTASTIDIRKNGHEPWFRSQLATMKKKGSIVVVEEFRQPVFHVMVSPSYGKPKLVGPRKPATSVAKAKSAPTFVGPRHVKSPTKQSARATTKVQAPRKKK